MNKAGEQSRWPFMLHDLVDQLLRQHKFDTRSLSSTFIMNKLQKNEYDKLTDLLEQFMRELADIGTLFCIIDGVALFERKEYCEQRIHLFLKAYHQTNDTNLSAVAKVLLKSTPGTNIIRGASGQVNLISEVGIFPSWTSTPSEEGIVQEIKQTK